MSGRSRSRTRSSGSPSKPVGRPKSVGRPKTRISKSIERTELVEKLKCRRKEMTLFSSPVAVVCRFCKIVAVMGKDYFLFMASHPYLLYSILLMAISCIVAFALNFHREMLLMLESYAAFVLWYVGLGIASSIGLGSGLHTFVLYVGPHIAQVTLAATSCNTLDFPKSGENAYVCNTLQQPTPTSLEIFWSVQMCAFLWGLGTAIGELPPYFMARAARTTGEHIAELDELQSNEASFPDTKTIKPIQHTFVSYLKHLLYRGLMEHTFIAIILFASIPNPLFDLAGLTCGHFGIKFSTFFGATLIGKAVIKSHLQSFVVILIFHASHMEEFMNLIIRYSPEIYRDFISQKLNDGIKALKHQYTKKHDIAPAGLHFPSLWELFLYSMLVYFLVSIIHATVQHDVEQENQETLKKFDEQS